LELDKQRAIEALITPFKEKGQEFIQTFSRFAYQKDLLNPIKDIETQERLALLSFMTVLFDSQKESKVHYKEVLELYKKDSNFFTLDNVLAMSEAEAAYFARKSMRSMAKKGNYLQTSYQHLKNVYDGSMLNVLDNDIIVTQKRLTEFKGIDVALSGLYVHTVRDHNIFAFSNEDEFCPKVDFHDYNIGRALGIIKDANPKKGGAEKTAFSYFLKDLAKEEGVSIFELDAFMWAASQLCVTRNEAICNDYCPLSKQHNSLRAYSLKNDYSARSTKAKLQKKIEAAKKLQGKLGF